MQKTFEQQKLEIFREIERNPALGLMRALEAFRKEMHSIVDDQVKRLETQLPSLALAAGVEKLRGSDGTDGEDADPEEVAQALLDMPEFIAMTKAKDGRTPTPSELLALIRPLIPVVQDGKTPSKRELLDLIRPLIPAVKDGKTPTKQELAEIIKPLMPKALYEGPEDVAKGLNTLEAALSQKVVKGLPEALKSLQKALRERGGGAAVGGGMGNWVHEAHSVAAAQTTVTLRSKVAANGTAILVRYQGQLLAHGVEYTINDKTITLLFTTEEGRVIDVTYVRT